MRGKTVSLGRDLNPIAVRVKNHAFIVPISGMARAIENRETVVFEPLRQCIDLLLRTHGERDMGQAHPLDPRLDGHRRERRRLHDLDASAVGKAEKTRFEAFGGIDITRPGDSAKVRDIELLAPFQICLLYTSRCV